MVTKNNESIRDAGSQFDKIIVPCLTKEIRGKKRFSGRMLPLAPIRMDIISVFSSVFPRLQVSQLRLKGNFAPCSAFI